MATDQLNQLINLVASITLFEMMVAIGLGVTFAEVMLDAKDWKLVTKAALASYVLSLQRRLACCFCSKRIPTLPRAS